MVKGSSRSSQRRLFALLMVIATVLFLPVWGLSLQSTQMPATDWLNSNIPAPIAADSVYDLVKQLYSDYHIPISFIDAGGGRKVTVPAGRLNKVLDQLIEMEEGAYRYEVINGRIVLYHNLPKYTFKLSGVQIKDKPRLEAAEAYVSALHQRFAEFGDLQAPPLFGDVRSPVFTEPVTLSPDGTVIEHLVQLLGSNDTMVFIVIPSKSGEPVLFFKAVK